MGKGDIGPGSNLGSKGCILSSSSPIVDLGELGRVWFCLSLLRSHSMIELKVTLELLSIQKE